MFYTSDMKGRYSPLYFLAALGAGGLAVSFFMYLLWLIPHKGSAIATFASIQTAWATGDLALQTIIAVSCSGIALFAFLHVRLIVWNVRQYLQWSRTPAYEALRKSNAETQLLVLPLTFAMSINVGFIVGAVFVPGLWDIREWLFPFALMGFGLVGVWAIRIFLDFIARVFTEGGFVPAKDSSLGQMIVVFTFSMVAVGFSAGAAMSHNHLVSAIGYMGAVFFAAAAILFGLIKLALGFRIMMEHTAAEETTPTLWIVIPILTVLGITIFRLKMALAHNFGTPSTPAELFSFLTIIVALQVFFGLLGWAVMRRINYFKRWISGPERSAGSYTLICPGVALFVSANFLVNVGFVKLGLIAPFSIGHMAVYLPLIILQLVTIRVFFLLNRKLLKQSEPVTTKAPR
ncbi:MAG: hypothetical protein P8Y47_06390 [Alphaproteobacteria bacterium]